MTKVKIVDIKERTKYVTPEKTEVSLIVSFETADGFRGTVRDIAATSTEREIWDAVVKAAKTPTKLIGAEMEV